MARLKTMTLSAALPAIVTLSISASMSLFGNAAWAQQPSQSLMHQQIQPTNQPANLMQGVNQNQTQIQNLNQSQSQSQGQNVSPSLNQSQAQNASPSLNQTSSPSGDTYNAPILRGLDQNNSASLTEPSSPSSQSALPHTAPVESFFQIAPVAVADQSTQPKQHGAAYKVLWHTMDNIGIPMFGNKDPDIDPALRKPFVMPPMPSGKGAEAAATSVDGKPQAKPAIIDPEAAAMDPSQIVPDGMSSKASTNANPTSNPQ